MPQKYLLNDRSNDLKIFCENELLRHFGFGIVEWQSLRKSYKKYELELESMTPKEEQELLISQERDAEYLAEMKGEVEDDEGDINQIQFHGCIRKYRGVLSDFFARYGIEQGGEFDFNILRDNQNYVIWLKFDPFWDCLDWQFDIAFTHSIAIQFVDLFIDYEYCDLNKLFDELILVRTFNTQFKDCGIGLFWRLNLNAGVRVIQYMTENHSFIITKQQIEQKTGKKIPFETATDFQAALNSFLDELRATLFKHDENANINSLEWQRGFYSGRWGEPILIDAVINQCRSELFIGNAILADMGWNEKAANEYAILLATEYLNQFFIQAQKNAYNLAEQEVKIWHENAVQKQNELVELELSQIARRKLPS